jgi:hypothetical protein
MLIELTWSIDAIKIYVYFYLKTSFNVFELQHVNMIHELSTKYSTLIVIKCHA